VLKVLKVLRVLKGPTVIMVPPGVGGRTFRSGAAGRV